MCLIRLFLLKYRYYPLLGSETPRRMALMHGLSLIRLLEVFFEVRSLFSACLIFLPDKEGWYINPRVEDSAWRAEELKVGSALLYFLSVFICLYATFFQNVLIRVAWIYVLFYVCLYATFFSEYLDKSWLNQSTALWCFSLSKNWLVITFEQRTCFWSPLMQADSWQTCRAMIFFIFIFCKLSNIIKYSLSYAKKEKKNR